MHTIGDPLRKDLVPLANGLNGNAYGIGCGCWRAAEKFDCFGLEHARLKHAFTHKASMLVPEVRKLAFMETFGERLLHALAASGKSRAELAAVLRDPDGGAGVSVSAVAQALNGITKAFNAENSARAARFLSVDLFWLATGEGEAKPQRVDLTNTEEAVVGDLRTIERFSPDTFASLRLRMAEVASGLRATHKLLHEEPGAIAAAPPQTKQVHSPGSNVSKIPPNAPTEGGLRKTAAQKARDATRLGHAPKKISKE